MPTEKLPEHLTPLASAFGFKAYLGDIHNHCNISYGHGSLQNALENAARQLDFVSVTGHAYWPDMPVDDQSVAHIVDFHVKGFSKLEKEWPCHFETLQAFDKAGEFTVFPGYEMHSNAHGDYTIVLKDLDPTEIIMRDTPAELNAALKEAHGDRAFAFPHHIGYRTGARGINWDTFEETLSPVLELISMHGCSESSLVDRPFLHSMGPCDGRNTVFNGWNEGHVFGVIGNTDHHSGYPGSYGHGRGVVYAAENTHDAIWDGINARRTNALTGDNIHLFAACDGVCQGGIIAPTDDAMLQIEAVAGSFIDYIDVVKNGVVIERITPSISPNPISPKSDGEESIFVLELGWGARGSHHMWHGNVSIDYGQFDSVEPRLRGAEIVSPLEGEDKEQRTDFVSCSDNQIDFNITAGANPNNSTSTTQAFASRVRLQPGAVIHATLCDQPVSIEAERLFTGAVSGNLGGIDTPAYRFHPLPKAHEWQWNGNVSAGAMTPGDWVSLRLRQTNGQWAWTSAFFCKQV